MMNIDSYNATPSSASINGVNGNGANNSNGPGGAGLSSLGLGNAMEMMEQASGYSMSNSAAGLYKNGWGSGSGRCSHLGGSVSGAHSFSMLEDQFLSMGRSGDLCMMASNIYPALLRHHHPPYHAAAHSLYSQPPHQHHLHHPSSSNSLLPGQTGVSGQQQQQQQQSVNSPACSPPFYASFDPACVVSCVMNSSVSPSNSMNGVNNNSLRTGMPGSVGPASLYMGFDPISHLGMSSSAGSGNNGSSDAFIAMNGVTASVCGAAGTGSGASSSMVSLNNNGPAVSSISYPQAAAAYMQYSGTTMTASGVSLPTPHSYTLPHLSDIDYDPRDLEAFAERFKQRRIKLGVTQADVGKALGNLKLTGVGSLSQSTICRFESLTLSHNNMVALKPVLQAWLEEAERQASERSKNPDIYGEFGDKKRKRTSITDAEKRSLEAFFAIQPRPSSEKISQIADKLNLKKNVVRVWFCNQRQKQKRMKFSTVAIGHHS